MNARRVAKTRFEGCRRSDSDVCECTHIYTLFDMEMLNKHDHLWNDGGTLEDNVVVDVTKIVYTSSGVHELQG